jgi:hypothetical protein
MLPSAITRWLAGLAPSSLAQWFAAVGTIGAVLVALSKDPFLAWKRRPRLDAVSSKETPWTVRTPMFARDGQGATWTGECYFLRARIENNGETRAEKVQVSAQKLAKSGADDSFTEIPTILPLNLKWSNSPPGAAMSILDGISSKMSAFCDIVALCDPANPLQRRPAGTPPNRTVGQLQLEVDPLTDSHLYDSGNIQTDFENCRSEC